MFLEKRWTILKWKTLVKGRWRSILKKVIVPENPPVRLVNLHIVRFKILLLTSCYFHRINIIVHTASFQTHPFCVVAIAVTEKLLASSVTWVLIKFNIDTRINQDACGRFYCFHAGTSSVTYRGVRDKFHLVKKYILGFESSKLISPTENWLICSQRSFLKVFSPKNWFEDSESQSTSFE